MRESRRDLFFIATLLAVAIVTLTYGYERPLLTTLIITTLAATTLWPWHGRQDVILGTTGLLVGPFVEWLATGCGLWTYATPSVAGLPLWVLPMWWIYPLAVTRLATAFTGHSASPGSLRLSITTIAAVVGWLCIFGVERPLLALLGTLVLLAAHLYRHHRAIDGVTLVVCGLIGPGAELFPVMAGAWTYPAGPLLGLPLWLPTGYGVFGVALIQLGLSLATTATRSQPHSRSTAPRNSPARRPRSPATVVAPAEEAGGRS